MDLLILLIIAALVRAPFIAQAGNLLDLDEATFGLMAKRILEGEIPLYFTGQSYLGSFVSFVMAPFVAIFGTTAFPVKLTALTFFLAFLAVNYALLKKIAGRAVAVFASMFLIMMPPGLLDLSLRVLGGHAELWVFQAAILLLLAKYFDGTPRFFSGKLLFATGLLIGLTVWICELSLLFIIPFLIYFFLRFREPQEEPLHTWFYNFFRLRHFRLPKWLRIALQGWHWFLLIFLLIHAAAIFLLKTPWLPSEWTEKFFDIFGAAPPFQIKTLKKIFLAFGAELLILNWVHAHPFSRLLLLKNAGPFLGGLLAGYFPAILFEIAGGEGLRIFQKSGALNAGDFVQRASLIFTEKIPIFVLGLAHPQFRSFGTLQAAGTWLFLGFVIIALGVTGIYYRKDLKLLYSPQPGRKVSYIWVFYFVGLFTILANCASTLEAFRYLSPLYIAIAVILGYFLGQILWPKWRIAAVLISVILIAHFGASSYRYYQAFPKGREPSYAQILDYLAAEKIHGGLAARTVSHILTYLSGEKIVFSTYRQEERYLPHSKYTETLHRRAYVFETDDSSNEAFRKDESLFPKVKSEKIFGPHVVYLVEEPGETPDLAYSPSRQKFPLHLFINE